MGCMAFAHATRLLRVHLFTNPHWIIGTCTCVLAIFHLGETSADCCTFQASFAFWPRIATTFPITSGLSLHIIVPSQQTIERQTGSQCRPLVLYATLRADPLESIPGPEHPVTMATRNISIIITMFFSHPLWKGGRTSSGMALNAANIVATYST